MGRGLGLAETPVQTCGLLAATRDASGCEGGWRAKKRKVLMARALPHAGASRRASRDVCGTGPRFSLRVTERISASIHQPAPGRDFYWPGGSSDAARVPCCARPAGAAPSSRFATLGSTPRLPQWPSPSSISKDRWQDTCKASTIPSNALGSGAIPTPARSSISTKRSTNTTCSISFGLPSRRPRNG
jgi:hypothetical protein